MAKHHESYRPIAQKFYKSWQWKKCRKSFIISKFGMCELCSGNGTHVHHVIELDATNIGNPDITLNHDNLMLLCHPCHQRVHETVIPTRKGMAFDEEGNLINLFNTPLLANN